MIKEFIYVALAALPLLMVYNAFAGATLPTTINAVTATDLQTPNIVDVTTKFIGLSPIESTVPAAGDSELNAVDISTSDYPTVNTLLKKSDLQYVAKVFESKAGTLGFGTYKIELFENGNSKGVLYIKQSSIDPETIKGVLTTWDIGNDMPVNAIYKVKVTQCPCA